ncbi:MAG: hypothetical protein ACRC9L_04125 [Brevinema sp.]
MSIYRRKDTGIYYLKVKNGMSYKRISLGTKNKDLAQALYQAYLAEKVKAKLFGLVMPPIPINTQPPRKKKSSSQKTKSAGSSLIKIHEKYLNTCKAQNITEYTMSRKIKTFESIKACGITSLASINQDAVNKLLKVWGELSNETQIRHIKNLKAFLNYGINNGLYSINTYKTLKFPILRGSVRDITISENDYQKLVQTARDRDFSLYLQALWETGCRPNEIVSLKKSDIDFDQMIDKRYEIILS